MKKIYLVCISIMLLMNACKKEVAQVANPITKASGITTTSTINGVKMIKDGYPYPNISTSSSLLGDEIGWFLDLNALGQNGLSNTSTQPIVSNLGDPTLYCGGINTINLYAGQNILMGTCAYANDATNLYVTYSVDADWYMTEIHLYAGSLVAAPKSGGGTPSPGRFPIKSTFTPVTLSQTVTYTIPISSLPSSNFIIAAHASVLRVDIDGDVVAKETAWAAGTRFTSNKNWATYISATWGTCGGGGGEGDLTNNTNTNK